MPFFWSNCHRLIILNNGVTDTLPVDETDPPSALASLPRQPRPPHCQCRSTPTGPPARSPALRLGPGPWPGGAAAGCPSAAAPQAVAHALWALARLRVAEPSLLRRGAARLSAPGALANFSGPQVSSVAWAYATLRVEDQPLPGPFQAPPPSC